MGLPAKSASVMFLMPASLAAQVRESLARQGVDLPEVRRVDTLPDLLTGFDGQRWDLLLSFGTGVIVPPAVLASPGLLPVNLHTAPPSYPGRDPHHFAAYDAVTEYGATLHVMTAAVDQGPILRVRRFAVDPDAPPIELLRRANAVGVEMCATLLAEYLRGHVVAPDSDEVWTGRVNRRKDFLELCRIEPDIGSDEFRRRAKACAMPGYTNLYTVIQGRRFVLEPTKDAAA